MTLSTVNQSYINGNGANEKEFLRLTEKFMPANGNETNNLVGEVFASAYRIYYEFHNNGNENALDVIEEKANAAINAAAGVITILIFLMLQSHAKFAAVGVK